MNTISVQNMVRRIAEPVDSQKDASRLQRSDKLIAQPFQIGSFEVIADLAQHDQVVWDMR